MSEESILHVKNNPNVDQLGKECMDIMDILIISQFFILPSEIGNNRFEYLARLLAGRGHRVEIVTTSFSHGLKRQRQHKAEDNALGYSYTMIYEPGYLKNVSLRRFWSHYIMGKNLASHLRKRKRPDLVYCAVPSLDVGQAAAEYARAQGTPLVVDVQDIWPEAFGMVFNVPILSDLVFSPMKRLAKYIYSSADKIVAVSQTYADIALQANDKSQQAQVVYLGTDLAEFDRSAHEHRVKDKPSDEIWLAYIGTLGHSYDLNSVIMALGILKDNGISNIRFLVMGNGPLKQKFEACAQEHRVRVDFRAGWNTARWPASCLHATSQ
jgi:hypothetical protein